MKQKRRGLENIRSAQRAKIKSMPKSTGRDYLDLYIMSKEYDRLKQEKVITDKRKKYLDQSIAEINQKIKKMRGSAPTKNQPPKEEDHQRIPQKPFKKMSLNY